MAEDPSVVALGPRAAARLISDQFPELERREVRHLAAAGTDNHIYRIGDDLCARFPKVPWAAGSAMREVAALPRFAGSPLAVPTVYGLGAPTDEYPHSWSVLTWLPGTPLEDSLLDDPHKAAGQLAEFFGHLRSVPADTEFRFGTANNGRGAPLGTRNVAFESALARLPGLDSEWASRLWSEALGAGEAGTSCWLHGDVHPGNVLIQNGQLSGIIDWGLAGVGNGACDLLSAWAMFDKGPREVFRQASGASDTEWLRGAGWALSMAVIYLPYAYENGLRCDMSEKMIERLMEDFA